ncbi:MAG: hypothetical protein ACHQCF_00875 [Solirubrobacterales bacterium]
MSKPGDTLDRGGGRRHPLRASLRAAVALALIGLATWGTSDANAGPDTTRIVHGQGKIIPIPASIPHEAGDMVDRRIVPDLLWIAKRYPIYITDGYSGPLPNGTHVGCDRCHTPGSDHYNGLAVDIVPVGGGTRCDATWAPITRLSHWAEPTQNHPVPPFRWVGYEGDAGHGCGNHLHLSWNHAPAPEYTLAQWVEVFLPAAGAGPEGSPKPTRAPGGGAPKPPPPKGPTGGFSQVQTGGLSPRD